MLIGEVPPDVLEEVCGADPSYVCEQMLELTDSEGVAETADLLFSKPFSILLIVVVAWIVLALLHRVIDRFVASLSGQNQPSRRIKRTLRRTPIVAQTLPDSVLETGAVSIRAAARAETLGHVLHSIAAFARVDASPSSRSSASSASTSGPLIAGAGIAGIALGFGAQSLVKDFLAGIFIIVEDQYGVGDIIDVGELSGTPVSGTVESVSLRATKLRSVNGTVWHVPNGAVLRVGNMSQQWARALLDVSVAYGSDLDLRPGRDQAGRRRALARPGLGRPGARGARGVGRRGPGPGRRHDPARREDAARRAVQRAARAPRPRIKAAPRRGRHRDPHRPAHRLGAPRPRHLGRRATTSTPPTDEQA